MQVVTGTVVDGKIVVEGLVLREGAVVAVLTAEDQPAVQLSLALQRELHEAIDAADAEVGGAGPEFLEGLRRYG